MRRVTRCIILLKREVSIRKHPTCERSKFVLQDVDVATRIEPSFQGYENCQVHEQKGSPISKSDVGNFLDVFKAKFESLFSRFSPHFLMSTIWFSLDVSLVQEHDLLPIFNRPSLVLFAELQTLLNGFIEDSLWLHIMVEIRVKISNLFFKPCW